MRKQTALLLFVAFGLAILMNLCSEKMKSSADLPVFENTDQMVEAAKKNITVMPVSEMKKLYDGTSFMVIIDVRAKEEYVEGYIPGAVNIPRGSLEFLMAKGDIWENYGLYTPEKTDTLVLYCRVGGRSALAAASLKQLGYKNVISMDGGWEEWNKTFPGIVEKITPEPPKAPEKPVTVATPAAKKEEPVIEKPKENAGGC